MVIAFSGKAQSIDGLSLSLPLHRFKITSGFGYRMHPVTGVKNSFHSGIDLRAKSDTVFSILQGRVVKISSDPVIGGYIVVSHGEFTSIYGHLSKSMVSVGEIVISGTSLGISGSSGRVTGEHLHFGLKFKGYFVNPLKLLYLFTTIKNHKLFLLLLDSSEVSSPDTPILIKEKTLLTTKTEIQ
ncbi:M23 family metallopeptidase [Pedobacter sp. R-06]|uniref:M23 family metallopeptidase n=1 Tax=Pedobacter sp. R-06 TaxID=3404051 RepID=UPI003CE9975D